MKLLKEAKRYVRRYYARPMGLFASNKSEIIKILIDAFNDKQNCTIYTLLNLGDTKDVTKLTSDDIIYTFDEGILRDKNGVPVFDYDLFVKHEEERPEIDPDKVSDAKFQDVYQDRLTDQTGYDNEIPDINKTRGNLAESTTVEDTYDVSDKAKLTLGHDKSDGWYVELRHFIGPESYMYQRDFYKLFNNESAAKKYFNNYKLKLNKDYNVAGEVDGEPVFVANKKHLSEKINNSKISEIDDYLEDVYNLRKDGLATEGQYGIKNQVFKKLRSDGKLDNLKDLKNKITSDELSLESLFMEDDN